jgi:hypothetical protein
MSRVSKGVLVLAFGVWACADAPAATTPVAMEGTPEVIDALGSEADEAPTCAQPPDGMRRMRVAVGHSTAHLAPGDVVDLLLVTSEVIPGDRVGGIPLIEDAAEPAEYEPDHEEAVVRPLLRAVSVACARQGAVEVMLSLDDASLLMSTTMTGGHVFALERVAPPDGADVDIYERALERSDIALQDRLPFVKRSKRCAQEFMAPTRDFTTFGADVSQDITTSLDTVLYSLPAEGAQERFAPGQRVDVLHGAHVRPHDVDAEPQEPVAASVLFAQGALVHSVTQGAVVLYLPADDALAFVSRRGLGPWEVLGRGEADLGVSERYRPRLPYQTRRLAEAREARTRD